MFVAGIEIFFGFVAGAILLYVGVVCALCLWALLKILAKSTVRAARRFGNWVRNRSEWIVGVVLYCWAVFVLCESDNGLKLAAGSMMAVALLVAALFKLYLFSNRKTKLEKP